MQLLCHFGIPPMQAGSLLTQLVLNLSGLWQGQMVEDLVGSAGAWSVSEPNVLTSFPWIAVPASATCHI